MSRPKLVGSTELSRPKLVVSTGQSRPRPRLGGGTGLSRWRASDVLLVFVPMLSIGATDILGEDWFDVGRALFGPR